MVHDAKEAACRVLGQIASASSPRLKLSWEPVDCVGSVARLLAVAMPMTIIVVAAFGAQVMGLSFGCCCLCWGRLGADRPGACRRHRCRSTWRGGRDRAELLGDRRGGAERRAPPSRSCCSSAFMLRLTTIGIGLRAGSLPTVVYAVVVGVAIGAVAGYGFAAKSLPLRDRKAALARTVDGWMAIGAVLLIYGLTELSAGMASWQRSRAGSAFPPLRA